MAHSAIYEGSVAHARRETINHSFSYPLYMLYLDLDEVEQLRLGPLWSSGHAAPVHFRRSDYLGDPAIPLAEAVRNTVRAQLDWAPTGPVRMLAQVRTWGWCFNPIALYYCFDADHETVKAVVASVTNTPWGETHNYVLDARQGLAQIAPQPKTLHVSPFMTMDLVYHFGLSEPSDTCAVAITARRDTHVVFTAGMRLVRRPLTQASLLRVMVRHPAMTHHVSSGIYRQAASLFRKRVALAPHPKPSDET